MSAFQQQRDLQSDPSHHSSYGSTGSSYQLILDHILTYPGSYEIPLRTMYTLNCAPRAQPKHSHSSSSSSAGSSPTQQQCGWQDSQATQTFTESLMTQISQLPSQPTSLPPSFITSFVRKCFPPDLVLVDFPQALTGLDYLKDLETRRRREVAAAMRRLDIDRTTLDMNAESLSDRYPGVLQWVKAIEDKERKVEALYTQLYVALRRWILINELSLLPYNKHNCVAMLNTLYPPVISTQPTSKLTPAVLKGQRDGFFKYIISVDKNGTRILNNLMQQGKAPAEDNGWLSVTRTLALYLQLANSIITECQDIVDVQDVSPRNTRDSGGSRTARKVDSGVSFGSDRPSTRSNSTGEPHSPTESVRPKTPSGGRPGTALEKLARGLKTIGRSRTDVTEIATDEPPFSPPAEKTRTLRKMRSLGALDPRKAQTPAIQTAASTTFDVEAMRLQRMKFDASLRM
ncbi:hypothetical protein LTR36_008741 [Oleoguttula mirabilis]|uniref:Uncharacterized protein n=1 Tax=Oleoguttula mirabilis TaxID=1507867 RepID=A0AAV9JTE8_9PEZI|nr:hypothetical protein LTR36_008741 [Oleoguttula mirabilis]